MHDLVRGIRNNRQNEVRPHSGCDVSWFLYLVWVSDQQARYIASCMDEIKGELKQENMNVKANAVAKLLYVSETESQTRTEEGNTWTGGQTERQVDSCRDRWTGRGLFY